MAYDWNYVFAQIRSRVTGLIPLKQDKTSEAEFYLTDAFEIYHFLPLCRALERAGIRARIVAEPPWINTAGTWFDYRTAVRLMKQMGVSYTTKANPDAGIAFTTQYRENLLPYKGAACQINYGVSLVAKADFRYREDVVSAFDYVLVHGAYSREKVVRYLDPSHVIIMSYPKFQDLRHNKPDMRTVRKKLGIETKKPVIVYYPTWDEYSSILTFGPEIGKLRDDFFIVTKPHHCTVRNLGDPTHMDVLRGISDLVVDANFPLGEMAVAGDLEICDMESGICTELPFISDRPRLCLLQSNVADEDMHPEIHAFSVIAKTPEDVCAKIRLLCENDPCVESRREVLETFYMSDIDQGIQNVVDFVKRLISSQV